MESTRRKAYAIALVLLAVAIAVVYVSGRTTQLGAPARLVLPDAVDGYVGVGVRVCQDDQCARGFVVTALADPDVCPYCSSKLDDISPGEKKMLPPDTQILKRRYECRRGPGFLVTAVLGGRERRSIHKPEVCVAAQGHAIVAKRVVNIALGNGRTLDVMVLHIERPATYDRSAEGGAYSLAYWFVSERRVTPHHFERLLWTALDGVVHNRRMRWAYISIASFRAERSDGLPADLEQFIAQLYPLLREE